MILRNSIVVLKSPCIVRRPSRREARRSFVRRSIFFLWRPMLRDARDDMVLELAVEAQCEAIVTFNRRDFAPASGFAIRLLTPGAMLQTLGGTR